MKKKIISNYLRNHKDHLDDFGHIRKMLPFIFLLRAIVSCSL